MNFLIVWRKPMVGRFWLVALAALGAISVVTPSWAADDSDTKADEESAAENGEDKEGEEKSEKEEGKGDDSEKAEDEKEKAADEGTSEKDASPAEVKGKTYQFVGARYRLIVVPKFMMNLFGDGGATVAVHSFGPEFAIRKDGFEYDFALTYAGYSMDPTPFKSKSDGEDAWELVESNIKVLYATVDFLWSYEFSPQVALNYGGGGGIGLVFGALHRRQAYKVNGEYLPCVAKGVPATQLNYCGTDNDHYGDYEEPSWANGGSKPVIFPWLALQTGLRYKASPKFVGRFDTGFGLSGFFFGIGADYGL
jgi:hypothetical protein